MTLRFREKRENEIKNRTSFKGQKRRNRRFWPHHLNFFVTCPVHMLDHQRLMAEVAENKVSKFFCLRWKFFFFISFIKRWWNNRKKERGFRNSFSLTNKKTFCWNSGRNFDFCCEKCLIFLKLSRNFCQRTPFKKLWKIFTKKSKFFCEMVTKCRSVRKNNLFFFDSVFESFMDCQSLLTNPLFLSFLFPKGTKCVLWAWTVRLFNRVLRFLTLYETHVADPPLRYHNMPIFISCVLLKPVSCNPFLAP